MVKKFTLVSILCLLVSNSYSQEQKRVYKIDYEYNPPSWIIGGWILYNVDGQKIIAFDFLKDRFCFQFYDNGNLESDECVDKEETMSKDEVFKQKVTNTYYKFVVAETESRNSFDIHTLIMKFNKWKVPSAIEFAEFTYNNQDLVKMFKEMGIKMTLYKVY